MSKLLESSINTWKYNVSYYFEANNTYSPKHFFCVRLPYPSTKPFGANELHQRTSVTTLNVTRRMPLPRNGLGGRQHRISLVGTACRQHKISLASTAWGLQSNWGSKTRVFTIAIAYTIGYVQSLLNSNNNSSHPCCCSSACINGVSFTHTVLSLRSASKHTPNRTHKHTHHKQAHLLLYDTTIHAS